MAPDTRERGAAAVEMAFITVFILVPLLIGLIDVGRLIYSHIALQEAAQEGALLGAFDNSGSSLNAAQIKDRVKDSTSFPDIQISEIEVFCETVARVVDAAQVAVRIEHTHDLLFPGSGTAMISKMAISDRFVASCPAGSTTPIP